MSNLFDLTGKKAIVTGGSKGIGKRLAIGLHDAGAEVVIFYNSTYPEDMIKEMQGNGAAMHAVQCNVAERASLERAVEEAAEILCSRIDILVNAAGVNRRYWLDDFPLDMWDEVCQVASQILCKLQIAVKNRAKVYGLAGRPVPPALPTE